jgi:hypothetical protein
MSSLCNYSHPEQQITEGLIRHKTGSLFPYNPEFYELASGLYGPGTLYCWYLLLASVIINWGYHKTDDKGYCRPGVSNDLLAALAYPVFAATDILIHSMRSLGMEYRALAIFCLRMPKVDLTGLAKFNDTQLDLRHIPPNILSLGQHVIDITGPLPVCYTFTSLMLAMILLYFLYFEHGLHLRPTKWAKRLILATCGYVSVMLSIFHLSLGDLGVSIILSMYETELPFLLFMVFCCCLGFVVCFFGSIYLLCVSIIKRDKKGAIYALKAWGCCLCLGVFLPGFMILCVYVNGVPLIPDLGISLFERDQIAALIGGMVTICFTLAHIYRSRKSKKDEVEEGV